MAYKKHVTQFENYKNRYLPQWRQPAAVYDTVITTKNRLRLSPLARQIVLDSFSYWDRKRYRLFVVVVMPDHVHAIFEPLLISNSHFWDPATILQTIKAHTAREINRHQNTRGQQVWQRDFYNRIVRDVKEFEQRWNYILDNPIRAGLSDSSYNYPWTWFRSKS